LFTLLSLLVILLAFSAYHIDFKEDISRFLPENKENERINNAYQYVASSNTVTVYCNFKKPENNLSHAEDEPSGAVDRAGDDCAAPAYAPPSDEAMAAQTGAIDALAERLRIRMDSAYIKSVFYSVNPAEMLTISTFIINNMPYFLDKDDYSRMDTLLTREVIARRLLMNKNMLTSSAGMILRDNLLYDPLQMTGELMRKLQNFGVSDRFRLYDDHLFNQENQAMMFIECNIPVSETRKNSLFLDSLESFITETEKEFPDITFDCFGASEIALANSRQIQNDTIFSMSLAVIIMLALLIYSFRSGRKIWLIFASVLFGGLFALAALHIISGDVSIIAVGISSIMFGIAINYPLHFMEHYNHAPHPSTVIKEIIEPLTIGNITTVGAFLSLVFIGSDAMRDLGLFASLLLIGTILFVLFFLPHLLSSPSQDLFPSRRKGASAANKHSRSKSQSRTFAPTHTPTPSSSSVTLSDVSGAGCSVPSETDEKKYAAESLPDADKSLLGKLAAFPFEKNRRLVITVILLTVFFSFFSGGSRFETNMQKINYMTVSHKKSFDKMMGLLNENRHVMYYVTEGKDLEAALEANERNMPVLQSFADSGEIYRIGGIGGFLPSRARQTEQIRRWNNFWSTRRDSVMTYLHEESRKTGFREDAFRPFEDILNRNWEVADLTHFNPIRKTLAKNYLIEKDDRAIVVNILYTDASKAQELEQKLNTYAPTDTGAFSIEDNRSEGTSNSANTDAFSIEDNRPIGTSCEKSHPSSIAFDAGSVTRRMISSLSDNFNYVLYVCGFIVFIFLIFSLGRIELTLIAFAPLALSWIWILGMMNLFDIRFNIVNIILATFIFGQGDDYTIFMTEGLMYEYARRRKILASYKKSIALSALIMFVGMGMLIFAKHPALRSLAEVTIVGMLSVVIMAYILPSLLFGLLTVKKGKKRLMPVTLKNLLITIYAFLFFLIMSTVITVIGWFMFTFGKTAEVKKLSYHKLLQKIARFVIYRIPQVKTTFQNRSGETFVKPGIIICNHQSHIDLMCIMMLTPKLIILTNNWVWNSPFYGKMIEYADFYPVSGGIKPVMDRLREAVDRGYSIVIFPEGTRSADCSIKRFHRGAFYLAEQLRLDLIPVLLHGAGHVLPKEEFMLRKGRIHIQVMPRITPEDARFRKDYSPRSIDVRHHYQAEYKKLSKEVETTDYYADLVLKNYIYKGRAVERAVRKNLRKNKNYAAAIAAMPDEGEVTIQNAGYGEYALLLSLVKKDLRITAIESNPDIRALAENCASVPKNLLYKDNIE
jgi:1-acyl-sn-glycerol-3-phosphate acyltransferase